MMTSKSMAAPPPLSLLTLLLLLLLPPPPPAAASVYFSAFTLFPDYQKMLTNFKIFIYPPHPEDDIVPFTPPLSLFYTSLNNTAHFITRDPEEAHLFFLPFPPQSTRSLATVIQRIRTSYPFWDRSLGADHFYLSCRGVGHASIRNVVELKKNAVQISCFPTPAGEFIPHKDVSLPPPSTTTFAPPLAMDEVTPKPFLGYGRFDRVQSGSDLIRSLRDDPQFLIEPGPSSDQSLYIERIQSSKFCLFAYKEGEVELLSVALAHGCVPVVITDRPIQDLPLLDVIRWSEIALFVGARVGHEELKRLLIGACERGEYENMRRLGMAAAHHFAWNQSPQPYDAFHMVMYQLWVRRHAIRYARWGGAEVA